MQFQQLLGHVRAAASLGNYGEAVTLLEKRVAPEHLDLAKANLMYFLPPVIVAMNTKEERRAAINSIPDECDPPFLKDYIKKSVRELWSRTAA